MGMHTGAQLNTFSVNRSEELWENANDFVPERWIPGHPLATKCQENLVSFGAGSLVVRTWGARACFTLHMFAVPPTEVPQRSGIRASVE